MTVLLRELATERPDDPAIIDDRGTVTWSELDGRVNRLIHTLRARGLVEGDSIALMAGNQREQFEVSLAGMQAGWLVVPVNWHLVADELAYIVDDAGAKALVVDDRWLDVGVEAASRSAGLVARIAVSDQPPRGSSSTRRSSPMRRPTSRPTRSRAARCSTRRVPPASPRACAAGWRPPGARSSCGSSSQPASAR